VESQPSLNRSKGGVSDISVGGAPGAIAVDSKTNTIYVMKGDGTISVISGINNSVTDIIPKKDVDYVQFISLAVNPNTSKVYAVDLSNDELSIINGTTNEYIKSLDTPAQSSWDFPDSVSVNPNTNMVYLAQRDHTVAVIDGSRDEVMKTIYLPYNRSDNTSPTGLTVNPNTNKIYVSEGDKKSVSVIDGKTNEFESNILISNRSDLADDIVVNSNTDKVYGMSYTNRMLVIDGNSKTLATSFIYNNSSDVKDIDYGNTAIAVNPKTNLVYIANKNLDTISVLDGSYGLITTVPVGKGPSSVAVNPVTNKVYVSNQNSGTVSVFEGSIRTNLLKEISSHIPGTKVGDQPIDIATDPSTNLIYVASKNKLSVINGSDNQIIRSVVANVPTEIAFNPRTNKLYMPNSGNNTLSIIYGSFKNTKNLRLDAEFSSGGGRIGIGSITNNVYYANWVNKTYMRITEIDGKEDRIIANIKDIPIYYISPTINEYIADNGTLYSFIFSHDLGPLAEIKLEHNPVNKSIRSEVTYLTQFSDTAHDIDINENTNLAYVIGGDVLHVIDLTIGNLVSTISIGNNPSDIDINPNTNVVYVANRDNDTISLIDGVHNKWLTDIKVGSRPMGIAVNPNTNVVYVANQLSNTVSVVDGSKNKVVLTMKFDINPDNSGHVECNKKEIPTNQYFMIESPIRCTAEPNNGFRFNSWVENLGGNSTKTVSTSEFSESPINSFLILFGFNPDDKAATFNVDHHGSFRANFIEVPPPIPPEYLIPLYGIIVSSIVGWSIPSIISWVKSRRESGRLHHYYRAINSLYDDGKLDTNDIQSLDRLKTDVSDVYAKGKITDQHYTDLKNNLSTLYEEVYEKRIDSLDNFPNKKNDITLETIKLDVVNAYAKGKINDLHYGLLSDKIKAVEEKKTSKL